MHNLEITRFSLHKFNSREDIKFDVTAYSQLKYGSGTVGAKFGKELAEAFYAEHYDILASKQLCVTESAYQFMQNAASMITDTFINRLNELIIELNGNFIHRIKINRVVPYIQDYGKVSLQQRVNLLKQDKFTMDAEYCKDKFMIFIDDIFITGTHQAKIEEMVEQYGLDKSNCMCVYYAELLNPYEDPSIESYLNSKSINTLNDLTELIKIDPQYRVIVRTAKMLLGYSDKEEVKKFVNNTDTRLLKEIYAGCLGEGYYKKPDYAQNFSIIKNKLFK